MKTQTLVIGVGNDYRSDDAVGLMVARRVRSFGLEHVSICEATGEGGALMEAWKEVERLILIDAVSSGAEAGTVHHFEAHRQPLPISLFQYSTHGFGVAEAIELARALNQLPPRVLVYGIEGRIFAAGVGLSPEVNEAAKRVVDRVLEDLAQR